MAKQKHTFEYHTTGKEMEGKNINHNYVYGFAYNKLLYKGKTKYQNIELYDTPWLGKLLKLDGFFQTSECDEFFYHEAMTHPAMCSHPAPKNILIIGGGDGGIMKNVLFHSSVKKVQMAEIDKGVVDFSKKYLSCVSGTAFIDKRAEVIIGDGKKFVEESREKYDLVISDLTDPVGPSKALYTPEFYREIGRRLTKDGIFMTHLDMATTRPEMSKWIYDNLGKAYKYRSVFVSYVPLYGSLMAFCISSNAINARVVKPEIIKKRLAARGIKNLKWYSPEMHASIFTLPPYLKRLFR